MLVAFRARFLFALSARCSEPLSGAFCPAHSLAGPQLLAQGRTVVAAARSADRARDVLGKEGPTGTLVRRQQGGLPTGREGGRCLCRLHRAAGAGLAASGTLATQGGCSCGGAGWARPAGRPTHPHCGSRAPRQVALGASGGSGRRPVGGAGAGGILFIESGVDITRPETLTPELFKGVTQVTGGPPRRAGPPAAGCWVLTPGTRHPRAGGLEVDKPAWRATPGQARVVRRSRGQVQAVG